MLRATLWPNAHPKVRFIEARELLPNYAGLHTDLIHPSDEGHLAMGEALARRLSESGITR